jgi:hypothetical protein
MIEKTVLEKLQETLAAPGSGSGVLCIDCLHRGKYTSTFLFTLKGYPTCPSCAFENKEQTATFEELIQYQKDNP